MQLKKIIGSFTITFNIHGFNEKIEHFDTLKSIFLSFENTLIVHRTIKVEELMKINQSGKSTIITDSNIHIYDEIRILVKLVSNFFIFTNQAQHFTLEVIEKEIDDGVIIVYGTEVYNGNLKEITFSPSIRAKWKNPQLINNLIEMN